MVDEDRERKRHGQHRQGEQESARGGEGQRLAVLAQPWPQPAQHPGGLASRLERIVWAEGQDDASEVAIESVAVDDAMAARRIVQVPAVLPDAFEDNEVVEPPEQDEGQRHSGELMDVLAPPGSLEAVAAGGAHDVLRVGAVAAGSRRLAQLLERDPPPEVGEHDAEGGGGAVGGFELHEHRRTQPPALARREPRS